METMEHTWQPESMVTQALGFFDDLCQLPPPQQHISTTNTTTNNNNNTNVPLSPQRNEWGVVPSDDEDESTFPSYQSTLDETNTLDEANTLDDTLENHYRGDAPQLAIPPLKESFSLDNHENFEVVLDANRLVLSSSPSPSPAPETTARSTASTSASPKSKKSLVKRLFGRNNKNKVKETDVAAPTMMERELAAPAAAPEASNHVQSLEPEEVPEEAPRIPSPPQLRNPTPLSNDESGATTNTNTTNDEIFSALESIFGGLNMDPDPVEEEKKDEDSAMAALAAATHKRDEEEDGEMGPDDETDANAISIPDPTASVAITVESRDAVAAVVPATPTKKKAKRGWSLKKLGFKKKSAARSADATTPTPSMDTARSATPSATPTSGEAMTTTTTKKQKPLWKTAVDPKTGKTYWYNRKTRVSTYNPPPEALQQQQQEQQEVSVEEPTAATTTETPATLATKKSKPVWKAVIDQNSGRTYYYHRKTRETTWVTPEDFKPPKAVKSVEPPKEQVETPVPAAAAAAVEEEEVQVTPAATEPEIASDPVQDPSFDHEEPVVTDEEDNGEVVVDDEVAEEVDTKQEIERLLAQIGPPSGPSLELLLQEYQGREEVLLQQLREKMEARPFDEPEASESVAPPVSPPRLNSRTMTFASKASAKSTRTEKTERIRNTMKKSSLFDPINENLSTATSISSRHGEFGLFATKRSPRSHAAAAVDARIPSRVPVLRERELKVEDLTSGRKTAVSLDDHKEKGRKTRNRLLRAPAEEAEDRSYMGDNEVDTYADSVSALSEGDTDFSSRKENFEAARRRALDDAIEREDWDLAAALSEGMKASSTTTTTTNKTTGPQQQEKQQQNDLDKFIANNDWHAVKSYISRKKGLGVPRAPNSGLPPRMPPSPPAEGMEKRIGSRSQLQHKRFQSDSSWTSDSYDSEESSETDYS